MNEVKMKARTLDNQQYKSTAYEQINADRNSDEEESDQDQFVHNGDRGMFPGGAGLEPMVDVTHEHISLGDPNQERQKISKLLQLVHEQVEKNQQLYMDAPPISSSHKDKSQNGRKNDSAIGQQFSNTISAPGSRESKLSERRSPTALYVEDDDRGQGSQSENSTSHTSQKEKKSQRGKHRKHREMKIDEGYKPLKLYHQDTKSPKSKKRDDGHDNQNHGSQQDPNERNGSALPKIHNGGMDCSPELPSPSSPGYRDKLHFMNNTSRELVGQQRNANKPNMNEWPLVINVNYTQYEVLQDCADETNFRLSTEDEEDWDVWWIDGPILPTLLLKMKPYQRTNHMPACYVIARKNLLARNLSNMYAVQPEEYDFFPRTWILPADSKSFKEQFNNKRAKTFIIKPESQCQGKGIFLTRNCDWVVQGEHYVAQRYLHKPYLIDGLKFDLRIYVLITGVNPLRCFVYKEGLARFATEKYHSPMGSNLNNLCMHLTNYAINKEADGFIQNQNEKQDDVGHKRSLSSILHYIDQNRQSSEDKTGDQVWQDIKQVCLKTILSGIHPIAHLYRSAKPQDAENSLCFQILGVDIFLDSACKSWLIEVNQSPSFQTDSPLDYSIKKNLLRDSLHILNLSWKRKNKYISQIKNEMANRLVGKHRMTQVEREQLKEKKLRDSTAGKNSYHRNKKEPPQEPVQVVEHKKPEPVSQAGQHTINKRKLSQLDVNGISANPNKSQHKTSKIGLPPAAQTASKKNSSMNATGQGGQLQPHFTTTHKQQREFDKRMSQKGGTQQQGLSKDGSGVGTKVASSMNIHYNVQGIPYQNIQQSQQCGTAHTDARGIEGALRHPTMNLTQQHAMYSDHQQRERKDNHLYQTPIQQFAFAQQDLMKQLEANFQAENKFYMDGMQIQQQSIISQQYPQLTKKIETPFRLKHPQHQKVTPTMIEAQHTNKGNLFSMNHNDIKSSDFAFHNNEPKSHSDYKHLRRSNYSQSQGSKTDFAMAQSADKGTHHNGRDNRQPIELQAPQQSSRTIDRNPHLQYPQSSTYPLEHSKRLVSGAQVIGPSHFDIQQPSQAELKPQMNLTSQLFQSASKVTFMKGPQAASSNQGPGLHQLLQDTTQKDRASKGNAFVSTPNQQPQLSSQHFGTAAKSKNPAGTAEEFTGHPTVFDYIQQNLNNRNQPQMLVNNQKGLSDSFDQITQNHLRQHGQKQQPTQQHVVYTDQAEGRGGFQYQSPQSLTSTGLNAQSSALIQKLGIPITDNNKHKHAYIKNFNNQQAHLGQSSSLLGPALGQQKQGSSRCSQNQFETHASMQSFEKMHSRSNVQERNAAPLAQHGAAANPSGNQSSKSKQSHRDSEQYSAFQQHFQHINEANIGLHQQKMVNKNNKSNSGSKSISQKGGIMQIMQVQNLHNLQQQMQHLPPHSVQAGPSSKFQQTPVKSLMGAGPHTLQMAGAATGGVLTLTGQSTRAANLIGGKAVPGGGQSSLAESGQGIVHSSQPPLRDNLIGKPGHPFSPNPKPTMKESMQVPILGSPRQRSGTGQKAQQQSQGQSQQQPLLTPSKQLMENSIEQHLQMRNQHYQPTLALRSQQARQAVSNARIPGDQLDDRH